MCKARQLAFGELARQAEAETGIMRTAEEIAHGALAIANDNMANAIKEISIARGIDISSYALVCFGGAGSQHACQVADLLGMSQVMIHPFASVLSAYGMGLADIRVMRQSSIERTLDGEIEDELLRLAEELRALTQAELSEQNVALAQMHEGNPASYSLCWNRQRP